MIRYYTDFQDVDEDVAAIADYGGQWMNVTGAGIFNRGLDDNPSAIWDDVVPMCRHLKIDQILYGYA